MKDKQTEAVRICREAAMQLKGIAGALEKQNDTLIMDAAYFATQAHAGQKRKYGDPLQDYINHPARVAAILMQYKWADHDMIAAAWLHDVIEDCGCTKEDIEERFGVSVASFVAQLTNPSKKHPTLPRAERKKMDREHIARCSFGAQWIKMADRLDNIRGMRDAPPDFKKIYHAETLLLIDAFKGSTCEILDLLKEETEALGRQIEREEAK